MDINYNFISQLESEENRKESDIISYAGKLLEIVGARTLVVGVDNDDKPFVFKCSGRLVDALDFD